jgi:hypothetical protein
MKRILAVALLVLALALLLLSCSAAFAEGPGAPPDKGAAQLLRGIVVV